MIARWLRNLAAWIDGKTVTTTYTSHDLTPEAKMHMNEAFNKMHEAFDEMGEAFNALGRKR